MHRERTTLPRQWALLKALPVYPRKTSIRQLWDEMDKLGYEVTKRTIERDLINLSQQFPIVSDDAKPSGWSIRSDEAHPSKTIERLLPDIKPLIQPTPGASITVSTEELKEDLIAELETLNQRFDPYGIFTPRVRHPKDFVGRTWLLTKIDAWLMTRHSTLLWLLAAPGMGKTAFLSWLSQHRKDDVVATYYCHYEYQKSPELLARDAVLSLAVQLGRRIPAYCRQLIGHEFLDRTALENQGAAELFDYLIVQPLVSIAHSNSAKSDGRRYVLVIDALDEAAHVDSQNVLLEIVLKYAKELPTAVFMIVSSRNELALNQHKSGVDHLVMANDDYGNQQDVCQWLAQELPSDLSDNQRLTITESLMQQSEGLFLYLKLLQPDLSGYIANPIFTPGGLDGFFLACFCRYFPDIQQYSTKQRPFLELLVSAFEPISNHTLAQTLGWDDYYCDQVIASFGALFTETTDDSLANPILGTYLPFDYEADQPRKLLPFHKALIDWLTDRTRAGLYRVIPQQGRQRWADSLWALYQSAVEHLPEYGLRYLPQHLAAVGRHQHSRDCLVDMAFILQRTKVPSIYADSYQLSAEYREAHARSPVDDALLAWELFFRANGHYLKKGHAVWPTERILLQLAAEQPDSSIVRKAANRSVENNLQGYWLRSLIPNQEAACRVLDDDYIGLKPLLLANDRIIGIAENGQIRVWDGHSGQRLLTLNGHPGVVGVLALDGSHFVTWSQGHQPCLSLWDINQGACLLKVANRGEIQQVCKLDEHRFIASFEFFYWGVWDYSGATVVEIDHLTHVIGTLWPLDDGYCLMDTHCRCNGDTENQLMLWQGSKGTQIKHLRNYQSHQTVVVKRLNHSHFLTYTLESECFQIWEREQGLLLATGDKQPNRPLCILDDTTPIRIICAHNPDATDQRALLNLRTWRWDGLSLTLETTQDLVADKGQELDPFDRSACVCAGELLEDGRVLLPSPLSVWSATTGEKIADLKGSWSLSNIMSDFETFYRRFDDGRLITWSEPRWDQFNLATTVYVWNRQGGLISEQVIASLFFDVQILNEHLFVTFNCDDTLNVWDARTGDLRQIITGLGAKINFVQLLSNDQLLIRDDVNHLSLWPLSSAIPRLEHRHAHATATKIKTLLFKDRILSYSLDTFPLRLWDANTGLWVATLPAYDSAIGAHLKGVIPLSRGRFLTWGHVPVMHIYSSDQGQCLATLQDLETPHLGYSSVWSLKEDLILCLLWDRSLRIYDLQDDHFDADRVIARKVMGANPVSDDRILYWRANGSLKLWNVATQQHDFDLLGTIEDIVTVENLSHHRVMVLAKHRQPWLIDWHTGKSALLSWTDPSYYPYLSELNDCRIALWSRNRLDVWAIDALPVQQFSLAFNDFGNLAFVGQLPNGDLLTQVMNDRATIWNVWCGSTGALLGSTLTSHKSVKCLKAYTVDQTIFLRLHNEASDAECFVIVAWLNPNNLQFLPLNDIKTAKNNSSFKKLVGQLGLSQGQWFFWRTMAGTPIGLCRLDGSSSQCEWHGQPINQFLKLTEDGRLLGFGRKPILLQLQNGSQSIKCQDQQVHYRSL